VRCGEDFVGLLMPNRPGDDEAARENDWRAAWLRRLEEPAQDDPDADRARSWLRDGHGVIVYTSGQTAAVSVGEGMREEERAQLAAAVTAAVETQDARPSTLKRKLRISIAEARALVTKLVDLEVVELAENGDQRVLVAAGDLQVCLAEHGLVAEPVPAG
jgi:hypothetical protein